MPGLGGPDCEGSISAAVSVILGSVASAPAVTPPAAGFKLTDLRFSFSTRFSSSLAAFSSALRSFSSSLSCSTQIRIGKKKIRYYLRLNFLLIALLSFSRCFNSSAFRCCSICSALTVACRSLSIAAFSLISSSTGWTFFAATASTSL